VSSTPSTSCVTRRARRAKPAGKRSKATRRSRSKIFDALGFKRNLVPLVTLIGGLCGGLGGFFFQYWVNIYAYPINVAGRPPNSWPAFIPVTFELTVLGASLAAVFGMLALNGLPEPYHPLFNIDRFVKHATTDKFYLCIEARDKKFNVDDAKKFFESVHATNVSEVQDD
jgi:hypothetical protein